MLNNTPIKRRLAFHSPGSPEPLIGDDPAHDLRLLYEKLKMNETRLELAAEAADAGLWSLDLDSYIFWTNEKIKEIFTFPRTGEITFQQFLERVHPDDHSIIQEGMRRALQEGEASSIEYRILLPDGTIRWMHSRGSLFSYVGKASSCLMGATVDITERKKNDEALIRQLRFEVLLAEISATFARFMLPANVDSQIEGAQSRILDYFGGDRCGLIMLDMKNRTSLITHAYYRDRLEKVPPDANLASMFPWSFDRSGAGELTCFSDLGELPPEAEVDRQSWIAMGVVSILLVPIHVETDITYLMLLQSVTTKVSWPVDTVPRLKMLGEVFTSAIFKKKAEEELRNSLEEIAQLKEKLEVEADFLRAEVRAAQFHDEIIGQSEPIRRVLALVEQVAPTSSTVLVFGETGTGKELIAQAIHNSSDRQGRMMVKVNCAALPASLVESELFGREKGAYTGALTRQMGRFELADASTLFLDEISELSLELQVKLLRVLQEGEFERLGSPRTIKVNVRVIAATNRNLLDEVRNGRFREDLYYRLNVFPIEVPSLRERRDDIPMLVWEFVRLFNEKMGKRVQRISKKTMASLQAYSWPGNIRELKNVIEYGIIVSPGSELQVRFPEKSSDSIAPRVTLEEMECRYIEDILRQTGWRIKGDGGAAQILGMNPATLYSRMKKLGISSQREKDGMSSLS